LDFSLSRVQVTIPVYQQMGEIRPPHYSASVEEAKEVAAHTTLSTPVRAACSGDHCWRRWRSADGVAAGRCSAGDDDAAAADARERLIDRLLIGFKLFLHCVQQLGMKQSLTFVTPMGFISLFLTAFVFCFYKFGACCLCVLCGVHVFIHYVRGGALNCSLFSRCPSIRSTCLGLLV
jgi:hypothetical protein